MNNLALSLAISLFASLPGTVARAANLNFSHTAEEQTHNQQLISLFGDLLEEVEKIGEKVQDTNNNVEGTMQGIDGIGGGVNRFRDTINGTTTQKEITEESGSSSPSATTEQPNSNNGDLGLPWE